MTARIPASAEQTMSAYLAQVEILRRAMSGVARPEALANAEAALDRMATKADLRNAIRDAKAACRANRMDAPNRRTDAFTVPAMPEGVMA